MGVFFSGTDTGTLNEYAKLSNFCISLIVNNKGEMIAKVAYPINNKTKRYAKEYKDSDGNWIPLTSNQEEEVSTFDVIALELDIVKEMDTFFVSMTDKAIKESYTAYNNFGNYNYNTGSSKSMYGNYNYGDDYDIDTYNKPTYNQSQPSLPKLFDDKPFVTK